VKLKLKNIIKNKKKIQKIFLVGGFTFFLVKGIIWLIIFLFAGFSLINFS
tara:strand:+ start:178 stop:327 length:150 start_codon:yes stop_codon:yes gene_type:complete